MMDDKVEKDTMSLKVWIVDVHPGEAENLRKRISESARLSGSEILVLKGSLVFGSDHIRSALYHARKAIANGSNASDSVAMETLLYSSGERQLNSAIKKMSVDEDTKTVAVICLSGTEPKAEPGWSEMPSIISSPSLDNLKEFGITEAELKTVSRARAAELVMEKVAAVDVLKK